METRKAEGGRLGGIVMAGRKRRSRYFKLLAAKDWSLRSSDRMLWRTARVGAVETFWFDGPGTGAWGKGGGGLGLGA